MTQPQLQTFEGKEFHVKKGIEAIQKTKHYQAPNQDERQKTERQPRECYFCGGA